MRYLQSVVKRQKEKWATSRKYAPTISKIFGILLIAGSVPYLWFALKFLLAGGNHAAVAAAILIGVSIIQGVFGICIARYIPVFMDEFARMIFDLFERLVGL